LDNTGAINKREFTAALEEHAVNATDSCKNSTERRIVSEFIIVTGIMAEDATMMSITGMIHFNLYTWRRTHHGSTKFKALTSPHSARATAKESNKYVLHTTCKTTESLLT
jgi:hypothetical protein